MDARQESHPKMDRNLRRTGIDALKEVPWGAHLCQLYEAEADLLEVLVPFMKAGLEQQEYCLWITAGSGQRVAIQAALEREVPDLAHHLDQGHLELVDQHNWYYNADGVIDLQAAGKESMRRLKKSIAMGLTGLRMTSSGHWRSRAEWDALMAYERTINEGINTLPVVSICCYPLGRCGPTEIAEIVSSHNHALVRQTGRWRVVENADHSASQQRAQESENNYRKVFETAASLITSVDEQGIIVDCNNRILDVLGYEKKEIIGQNMGTIIHPDYHAKAEESLAKILEQGFLYDREYKMVRKDGQNIDVVINSSGLWGADGSYDRTICIISDVTETNRLRAVSRRSDKMQAIGTLAGGIAHDFNNLLGVIQGNVSYALQSMSPGTELKELLSDVLDGAHRAQGLTQQLLTFAEGGEPIKEPTSLAPLVKESATATTATSQCRCEVTVAPELPLALVDPGQMTQVVRNLVRNACQAMSGVGRIRIQLEAVSASQPGLSELLPGSYILASFQDEGTGIADEDLPRIFEPFFTKGEGPGLGLATVFSVVKRHGGAVTVDSAPGQGTTFRVYLPVANPVEEVPAAKPTPAPHRRVLVMDDQQAVQRMVCRILDRMEFKHEVSADGATAVELYRQAMERGEPFDLVILDLTVPTGLGGRETIQLLKEVDPSVQAVVSSGYANDPVMASYQDYGFAGVLAKPYTFKQFQALIGDLLGT